MRQKLLSALGMLMVGDAVDFLVDPRGQVRVWSAPRAPSWYQKMMGFCERRPGAARAIAIGELAAAIALLWRARHVTA